MTEIKSAIPSKIPLSEVPVSGVPETTGLTFSKKTLDNLRIGILKGRPQVIIYSREDSDLFDKNNKLITSCKALDMWTVKLKKTKLELLGPGKKSFGEYEDPIILKPKKVGGIVGCAGKLYKNILEIKIGIDGLLLVVNIINIDEYLKGVVPREIGTDKHIEALKAQAVTARTCVFAKMNQHATEGYNLCSEVCCQVYGGFNSEHPRTNQAVEETKGIIVTYQGGLAHTLYHATCGGYVESGKDIFGGETGYLVAVPCFSEGANREYKFPLSVEENFVKWIKSSPEAYCKKHKRYRWEKIFTKTQLENIINKTYSIGKLKDIKLGDRTYGGTLKYIEIVGSDNSQRVDGQYKIRMCFGGVFEFYSGKFIIEKGVNDQGEELWKFIGGGWGHGTGMCQYGANEMAGEYNKTYEDIITHYFPGTKIEKNY